MIVNKRKAGKFKKRKTSFLIGKELERQLAELKELWGLNRTTEVIEKAVDRIASEVLKRK